MRGFSGKFAGPNPPRRTGTFRRSWPLFLACARNRGSNRQRESNNPLGLLNFVTLSAKKGRIGVLTECPSAAPLGLTLGPPNPRMITIAAETLGFRCAGISPALRLLMPTFSLPNAPPNLTVRLRRIGNALLPLPLPRLRSGSETLVFGIKLEPRVFTAQNSLASKLLRTF